MSGLPSRSEPGRWDGRREGALTHYRDLLVLRWLCEQYAARLDHLEVLTGRCKGQVEALLRPMRTFGFVRMWRIVVGEPTWVLPTDAGLRRCELPYEEMTPRSTNLPHLAAVNEVRLHVQMHVPESVWVSRRELMHGRHKGVCVPHGLVLFNGHRAAIEVRLDAEPVAVMSKRLERLERRFEQVYYYCAPRPHRQLTALKKRGEAPRLQVRELPALPAAGPAAPPAAAARPAPTTNER